MFTLYVCHDGLKHQATIHLVAEDGPLAYSGPSVASALHWLQARGEFSVVCMTDGGPELFLIEPCGCPTLALPSVSLRRAHVGRCDDPPRLLGLEPDPIRRARILEDRALGPARRAGRRQAWLRRATTP